MLKSKQVECPFNKENRQCVFIPMLTTNAMRLCEASNQRRAPDSNIANNSRFKCIARRCCGDSCERGLVDYLFATQGPGIIGAKNKGAAVRSYGGSIACSR